MSQKFRVKQMRVKSEANNRSGIVTENMTSATADQVVGTTFKNVQVNENGEFVVWPNTWGWSNIYTNDGTLTADRTVTMSNDWSKNLTFTTADLNSKTELFNDSSSWSTAWLQTWFEFTADWTYVWSVWARTDVLSIQWSAVWEIEVISSTTFKLDSAQDYRLVTAPTTATTQTQALVRDASNGRIYLKTFNAPIQFQDEWVNFWVPWQITTVNFTGAWVTWTISGSTLTIDIPSGWSWGWVNVYHAFDYPWWPFSVVSPNHWDLFFFWFGWLSWVYWNASFANWLPIE